MEYIIIFAITFFATLLSSMSGGGAGIIVYPALLSMGLPFPLVGAVSAVNSTVWVLPAGRNYLKGRKVDWKFLIIFSLIGLIGCYFGVLLMININQRILEISVGAIILFLVSYTYFKKDMGLNQNKVQSLARQMIAYPFALLLGFYETIFGSGNGILFTMITLYTRGFDFIDGLGHYYYISFSWALFAAVLLIQKGYYDVNIMAVAAIGSILGGFLGSKYAKNKGNKFIKTLFVIIGGILGIKLLLGL
ncbi:MAG: sulfite exporter TauE/SafE family protein [Candidatus Nomurabacteria bacterium]|nr:sulfite exporter TauE/SafE family protein [Candidatus Nomurabacteria bacterium]